MLTRRYSEKIQVLLWRSRTHDPFRLLVRMLCDNCPAIMLVSKWSEWSILAILLKETSSSKIAKINDGNQTEWSAIGHFRKYHNTLCPSNFCMSQCLFSLGTYNGPKRNWKQCSCKIWRDKEYYGISKYQKYHNTLCFFLQSSALALFIFSLWTYNGRKWPITTLLHPFRNRSNLIAQIQDFSQYQYFIDAVAGL